MMVGASKPTKVIQEPCLNVPKPAARYQKRVGAQKLQTAPPPVTLLRFFSGQPCSPPSVQHHACDPQPFASSPAGRGGLQLVAPVLWTRGQRCHGMAAGEGKGTQPDPAQPTVARPKGKGKGQPQDPSSGKAKARGKSKTKASRTPPAHAKTRRRKKPIGWPEPDGKRGRAAKQNDCPAGQAKSPQTRKEGGSPSGSRGPPGDNR